MICPLQLAYGKEKCFLHGVCLQSVDNFPNVLCRTTHDQPRCQDRAQVPRVARGCSYLRAGRASVTGSSPRSRLRARPASQR